MDTFTVALDTDIIALGPAFAYGWATNPVINQITEPLLVIGDKEQPDAAEGLAKSYGNGKMIQLMYIRFAMMLLFLTEH
ncbi:MAG: hypothetical protein V8R80_11660 [Eubacterium sp.]